MFQTGSVPDTGALLIQLDGLLRIGHPLEPIYDTAADVVLENLEGTAASVLETFTLVCLDPLAGTWSVTGSVSGALPNAVEQTTYSQPQVIFLIAWGTLVPPIAGDTITFVMTPPWVTKRGTVGQEYIWQAPGDDGVSPLYVGMSKFESVAGDYSNLRLGGFTGFDPALNFFTQPGALTRGILPSLRVGSVTYWASITGRRLVLVLKVSAQYEMAYLGFINPYDTPGQFPYPLFVGGSMAFVNEPPADDVRWRWSYNGAEHCAFPWGAFQGSASFDNYTARLRRPDGAWLGFQGVSAGEGAAPEGYVFPYAFGFTDMRANLDGTVTTWPILLSSTVPSQVFGELDGVSAVHGFANVSENTVTIERSKWLVVQNITRTGKTDYCAVRLA